MRGRKPSVIAFAGPAGAVYRHPPTWLPKYAKEEWVRALPPLIDRRTMTEADYGCFESYCLAIGQVRDMQAAIAALPSQFVSSETSAPRPHPAFRLMHEAMRQARQLAAELGLTPVSRSRASMTAKGDNDDDWVGMDM